MARANAITIGQRFGKLTVVSRATNAGHHPRWNCICDCGQAAVVHATNLQRQLSQSCGCSYKTENSQSTTREWSIWTKMISRCYDPNWNNYKHYGAKGVIVCDGWRESFENFLADMGRAPSLGHTLDRIRAGGGYACGHCDDCKQHSREANCRWATKQTQDRNRKVHQTATHNGRTMLLKEWAESGFSAVGYHALYSRLLRGWNFADALSAPPNARRPARLMASRT